jgi:hypothetical protein
MSGGLEPHVRRVRLAAEAALLRRWNAGARLTDGAGDMFVRDPDARSRLTRGTLKPVDAFRKAATDVAAALATADRALATGASRLVDLCARFDLDAASRDVLAASVAYELDADVRELIHAAAPRRRPGLWADALLDVCPSVTGVADVLAALHPAAPLRRSGVIATDGDGLDARLDLRAATASWLCGDDRLPAPLDAIAKLGEASDVWLPDAAGDVAARAAAVADRALIVIRGVRGSGRVALARRIARALGRDALVVPVDGLVALERATKIDLVRELLVEATSRDAVAVLADIDALLDAGDLDPRRRARIASHRGALVVTSAGRAGHLDVGRPAHGIDMPRPTLGDREHAWRHALARVAAPAGDALADELAARYVLGPGAIADVADEAQRAVAITATPVDRPALEAAVGRRLSLRLGSFGTVVHRKARFAELILPDDVVDTLHDMIAMVRERAQILERWGYQRHLGLSRGVSALFSGEPGTGKTMAASVLASELGLELIRIDLAAVVSKYVGETEKNLGKIFDQAQDAHAMLLFDEADSLFGKRTELKSAQDRFANLEVNYILQRMESFDGISVLTTNAEAAIDQALQRRLNFRIRFPEPEVDERILLWQRLLPPDSVVDGDIDFRKLAERFDMTGGYIKNAIVRAAVIAARAGRAVTADDLWTGALHEYAEMGKVMPSLPRS